jgi:hypothetical protein
MEQDVDGVEQKRSGAGKELKGQKNVIFVMSVYGGCLACSAQHADKNTEFLNPWIYCERHFDSQFSLCPSLEGSGKSITKLPNARRTRFFG